jgi:hypothetical protein
MPRIRLESIALARQCDDPPEYGHRLRLPVSWTHGPPTLHQPIVFHDCSDPPTIFLSTDRDDLIAVDQDSQLLFRVFVIPQTR